MPETCERNDFGVVTTSSSTSSTTMATSEYLFVMGFVYVYSKTKLAHPNTFNVHLFSAPATTSTTTTQTTSPETTSEFLFDSHSYFDK